MSGDPANSPVGWGRVLRYTLVLFLLTFAAGCVGGFAAGVYSSARVEVPAWVTALRLTLGPAATVLVFAWVGRAEAGNPTGHAAAVWAFGVVITFVLNAGIMRLPLAWVVLSILPMTVGAVIGTALGVLTRRAKLK